MIGVGLGIGFARKGRTPAGAILHYDAGISPLTELVGGVHTLNYSVLEPQYQRLADGGYINVGSQPAVDVLASGIKGLRTCGAITNLLPGDTSIARTVTLTAQVYTLQVIGAGSASCSYGTATVGSPLTFTAAAGTTTFTPFGATLWILTATPYPVPYVPPGVTQPASNATATNGTWFALPDGSELWQALTGSPFTLATRIVMGILTGELPNGVQSNLNILTPHTSDQFLRTIKQATGNTLIVTAYDGALTVQSGFNITYTRNAVIQRFAQVNTAGTRFRVGYLIEGTHSTIQWSHPSEDSNAWAVFDGSFNPSTLYRFMLGYNNLYPMWFNKITGWARQVPTTELEAWA